MNVLGNNSKSGWGGQGAQHLKGSLLWGQQASQEISQGRGTKSILKNNEF